MKSWKLRLAVLVTASAYILLSPILVQIPALRVHTPFVRGWRMYAGVGRGTCDVTIRAKIDGVWEEDIDYVEAFHGKAWHEVTPRRRRVIRKEVANFGRHLCRKLNATDLRVVKATCGTRGHWVEPPIGERNLCLRHPE